LDNGIDFFLFNGKGGFFFDKNKKKFLADFRRVYRRVSRSFNFKSFSLIFADFTAESRRYLASERILGKSPKESERSRRVRF
jgi:hypothetical protein